MASILETGTVIQPVRNSPTNAPATTEPTSGVVRDVRELPGTFDLSPAGVFDSAADQYRASFSLSGSTSEYLVFAANTSNFATVDADAWAVLDADANIPEGTRSVLDINAPTGQREDGSPRLVIKDRACRTIARFLSVTVVRGDDVTETEVVLTSGVDFTGTPEGNYLTVIDNATTQSLLTPVGGGDPGFSSLRGDRVTAVSYVVEDAKFWWSRNDTGATPRFGWDGREQKWAPLPGGSLVDLGVLSAAHAPVLNPLPFGLGEGDWLPGLLDSDAWCMLRVGASPDAATSYALSRDIDDTGAPFNGVLVVSDAEASSPYTFVGTPEYAGVMGVTSGLIQWNPDFVAAHAGQTIWYSVEQFDRGGLVGDMLGADTAPLFLAPAPTPVEFPLLRFGLRQWLTVNVVDTEAELLALPAPTEGTVAVARSTGRVRLSQVDIDKTDPDSGSFDVAWLGTKLFYDGVVLSSEPQPLKAAAQGLGSKGGAFLVAPDVDLYVGDSSPLPGLGVSGILSVPDGTGAIPTTGDPAVRPGGDDPSDPYTGLIRQVESLGDTFAYTQSGPLNLEVVDRVSDLPSRRDIPAGTAYISRESQSFGSVLRLSDSDAVARSGEEIYFRQCDLTPARYQPLARAVSRRVEPFVFSGGVLHFAIDGTNYQWDSSALGVDVPFSARQVAASIDAVIVGLGSCRYQRGHVIIEADDPTTGVVEIGFGTVTRELDTASELGFTPGWRVDTANSATHWLVDSGLSLGMFRSGSNPDGSRNIADSMARGRLGGEILQSPVLASPSIFLSRPPLRDVAGYDYEVFFSGDATGQLEPRTDLEYRFESTPPQIRWLGTGTSLVPVTSGGSTVSLGQTNLVPSSFDEEGSGVFLAEDGNNFVEQEYGVDFLLADPGGATGAIRFIETYGAQNLTGGRGSYSAGSGLFTDPDATFTGNVDFGNQLVLTSGPNAGSSYIIESISLNSVQVAPDFLNASGTDPVSWVVLDGERDNTYDPTLLADVVYLPFHHLDGREPFEIDLLSSLGTTPVDDADQIANRLVALVEDSVESGRSMFLRFGRVVRQGEATLNALQKTVLGVLENGSLFVPNTVEPRFAEGKFSIRIANTEFANGVVLTGVASFTSPIPAGQVEYLTSTGELGFAPDLLSDYEGSQVVYLEEFNSAANLSEGEAEFDPLTGEVNISADDLVRFQGSEVYLRERMILENRLDVVVSPLNGSLSFNKVLRESQIVEVSYYQADSSGNQVLTGGFPSQIIEQLPVQVRREQAARRNDQTYFFNFQDRTIDVRTDIVVYVDQVRQNYGTSQTVYVDVEQNLIRFLGVKVEETQSVQISYSCFESLGGEKTYRVSSAPVYRPAFLLRAGENSFSLPGDKTSSVERGMLLRLGASALYIEDSVYDASSEETVITTYPTLDFDLGSTSPGNEILSLITSTPVTTVVNGKSSPNAPAGFRTNIANAYLAVRRLANFIDIRGDATQFAVAGHVLELGGEPYFITGSERVNEGSLTRVFVAQPFRKTYNYGTDILRMSVRPIYPNGARQILGVNPLLSTQDFSLVLFGEVDADGNELPGRELTLASEYTLDSSTGTVHLQEPNQDGFGPSQKLFLRYTKIRTLGPKVVDGVIQIPRVLAKFSYNVLPTADSGRLGDTLRVDYDYRSPDSFYCQVQRFADYLSEVVSEVEGEVLAQTGSGGALVGARQDLVLSDQGFLGTQGKARELLNKDRVARVASAFYHRIVDGFDQVSEAITGEPIGDRDGRFGMFLGAASEYPQPGYEDDISGYVNVRSVWSELSLKETADRVYPLVHLETDPLVDPATATLASGVLSGTSAGARLPGLLSAQEKLVLSHVDDRVLLPSGQYVSLSEPSVASRLFSLAAQAFVKTVAGLGTAPGEYGSAIPVENPDGSTSTLSTYLTSIAQLENPSRGALTNVLSAAVRRRLARARVVSVEEMGVESLDATTSGRVTLIASLVGPESFPWDASGLPETTLLQSQSADPDAVVDIETGDDSLSLPAFESYVDEEGSSFLQVSLLKPSGEVFEIRASSDSIVIGGREVPSFVYVDTVSSGCLVTLQDVSGNPITALSQLQRVLFGGRVEPLSLEAGDVLIGVPSNVSWYAASDPYTQADIAFLASTLPFFRLGYDVEIDRAGGLLLDITQADPAQNAPQPLEELEASVSLSSFEGTAPLALPALVGQPRTDDGDAYYPGVDGELESLRGLTNALSVLDSDSAEPGAAYPYELPIRDGAVQMTFSGGILPGSLVTSEDLLPVTTGGFTSGSGDADLQPYDVLLVRTDEFENYTESGLQGIFSVGDVFQDSGNSYIDLPKWVTQSRRGDRIRYNLQGAMNSFSGAGTQGVTVEESGGNTIFDISSMASLVFNDGSVGTTGGLNHILDNTLLPYPNENEIVIRIYNLAGTAVLDTITITGDPTGALGPVGGLSQGGLGQQSHTQPVIGQKTITVPATGFVNMAALGGGPGPVGPFNFRLSVFTSPTGGIRASSSTTYRGSDTARIGSDRLTFTERIDLSTTLPNGFQYGIFIQHTTLNVDTVTGPNSENIEVNTIGEVDNDSVHFLDRDGSGSAGEFAAASGGGAGDELGTLRAPGFVAWGTVAPPIVSEVHMQAIPSSAYNVDGVILSGEGLCDGGSSVFENRITQITTGSGALSNVQKGDIVAITSASDGAAPTYAGALASTKCGTYLVRQVVTADGGVGYREDTFTVDAGDDGGWLQATMPSVVSASESGTTLTVSNLYPIADSPTGHSFPASGRVYVLIDTADLESSTPSVFATALVSAAYASVDSATRTFQGLSTYYDASGSVITATEFFAAASVGRRVSGMQYLGVQISDPDLPTDNLVGYDTASSPNGLRFFELGSSIPTASATEIAFDGSASEIVDLAGAAAGKIVCVQRAKEGATTFVTDPTLPVYDHVPGYLDLTQITKAQWDSLNREATIVSSEVSCLLPGMELAARGPASDGFWSQSGIFLEPSWPLTVSDIGASPAKLVASGYTTTDVGMRQASSFNAGVSPEPVAFEVRRTRRFSQEMRDTARYTDTLSSLYHPVSVGQVFAYTALDNQSALVTVNLSVSIGFSEVEAGDLLVLRDASGTWLGECLVQGVRSETDLVLRPPGIPGAAAQYYQVYKRRASAPIVQSAEQLLAAVAEEVFRGTAGEVTDTGTYADSINILRDSGVAFATEDIAIGDYLVIDPAGQLILDEYGAPPQGDTSVSVRGNFSAGSPSPLDDNRGFYRIVEINPSNVVVTGSHIFAGDLDSGDVILGGSAAERYVVYPTVAGSILTGGVEGQNDLRPTSPIVGSSFAGNYLSIEPFNYCIIRPFTGVSQEAVELVLHLRERALSFAQMLDENAKSVGSYFRFQDETHTDDLNTGTLRKDQVAILEGEVATTPFSSSSTGLSLLDRRFWTKDQSLNRLPSGGPYYADFPAGEGLPVLVDYIDRVVATNDAYREIRQAWLEYRTDLVSGTLSSIRRGDSFSDLQTTQKDRLSRLLKGIS